MRIKDIVTGEWKDTSELIQEAEAKTNEETKQ